MARLFSERTSRDEGHAFYFSEITMVLSKAACKERLACFIKAPSFFGVFFCKCLSNINTFNIARVHKRGHMLVTCAGNRSILVGF